MPKGHFSNSEERARNISKALLGRKLSPEHIKAIVESHQGKPSSFKGKHHTEEAKIKQRLSHLGKISFRRGKKYPQIAGDKHPMWRGGVTPIHEKIRKSLEYKIWRKSVFERDNYTCIWCGDDRGGNLNADHIKPFSLFPELRFALDNGRTLCKPCHQKIGWKGNQYITAASRTAKTIT